MDFKKEALLYIAMLFVSSGGLEMTGKNYFTGSILLLIGAGIVIVRGIYKTKIKE